MDHLGNIKKAFNIVWHNKFLWVLGFIVTFLQQSSGFSNSFQLPDDRGYPQLQEAFSTVTTWWTSLDPIIQIGLILSILFLALSLSILFMYIGSRAEAGLIKAVDEISDGKHMNFKTAWKLGGKYAWRLLGQKLVLNLPVFILTIISTVIAILVIFKFISNSNTGIEMASLSILSVLFICILLILILIFAVSVGVIYTFSSRKAVLNNTGIIQSVSDSLAFLKNNFSEIILSYLVNLAVLTPFGIILFVVYLILGIFIFIPIIFLMIFLIFTNIFLFIVFIILAFLLVQFFGSLVSGIFTAYSSAYWTIVYKQLEKK